MQQMSTEFSEPFSFKKLSGFASFFTIRCGKDTAPTGSGVKENQSEEWRTE